jgi:hypothetical protein
MKPYKVQEEMNGNYNYNQLEAHLFNRLKDIDPNVKCITSGNEPGGSKTVEFLGWEVSLPNSTRTSHEEELWSYFHVCYGNQQYIADYREAKLFGALVLILQKHLNEGACSPAEYLIMENCFLC